MKRLRMEDPRDGKVTYGPPIDGLKEAHRAVWGPDGCSLEEALIRYWMHGFLWALGEADRLEMLELLGVVTGSVTPWELEQAIGKLKLKGWEDFSDSYSQAPIRIEDT